jgi:DNA-binding MarR family transcriptional regulator
MARAATQKAERPVESAAIDFAGLSDLAGFVVHLANLQLYRDYYERFAGNAAGLTLGAFSVMALIDANPGLRQGAAAEALLINRLERQGLVRRRASGRDRRSVGLHLTPLGRRRLGLMLPAIAAHDAEATAPLDVRERRLLVGLLGKVVFAKRAP